MTPYGHIKLSRKLFDGDPWWTEKRVFSRFEAWVDILQLTAWRETTIEYRGEPISLGRGEFVLSVRHAATRWGWPEKRVRSFFERAQQTAQHSAHRNTPEGAQQKAQQKARLRAQRETQAGIVYLVVNYDFYQAFSAAGLSENGTPDGTANGTPDGTPDFTERAQQRAQQRAQEESSSSSRSLPEQRFLAALSPTQRVSWAATLDGWRNGMGFPNGRPADNADIDVGLTEYLASEKAPTFSAVHVKAFVVKAERDRIATKARDNDPYFSPEEIKAAYEQ